MDVVVTRDPDLVRRADRARARAGVDAGVRRGDATESGVADALREAIARGAPVLGICVGLQILFEEGEEAGGAKGLGIVLAGSRSSGA